MLLSVMHFKAIIVKLQHTRTSGRFPQDFFKDPPLKETYPEHLSKKPHRAELYMRKLKSQTGSPGLSSAWRWTFSVGKGNELKSFSQAKNFRAASFDKCFAHNCLEQGLLIALEDHFQSFKNRTPFEYYCSKIRYFVGMTHELCIATEIVGAQLMKFV